MNKQDFTDIVMNEGLTEGEAAWLWAGNPKGEDCPDVPEIIAEGVALIMPALNLLRSRPGHEESMAQYLSPTDEEVRPIAILILHLDDIPTYDALDEEIEKQVKGEG